MTAFDPRAVGALALAASLAPGLAGCIAAPRYPVETGQASGGGFAALQPRYAVRLEDVDQAAAAPGLSPPPSPATAQADPVPRAAPSAAVSVVELAPPAGSTTSIAAPAPIASALPAAAAQNQPPQASPSPIAAAVPIVTPLVSPNPSAAPVVRPAVTSVGPPPVPASAAPETRVSAGSAPAVGEGQKLAPAVLSANASVPVRGAARSPASSPASITTPFLQSGMGAGPPRFTIGAPAPAVSSAAAGAAVAPVFSPTYARPSQPAYAASSTLYGAAPAYPRPGATAPVTARPYGYAVASPQPAPAASSYGRSGQAAASFPPSSSSGESPRPYASLYPQGRSYGAPRPSGSFRSAGIRSTPRDPGIAPQPLTLPAVMDASPASTTEAASLGRGRFTWPLRGQLLSGYGDKGGGQRNDGLNIAANVGDPVRSSAAGEVVYAGELVPGQGKLVLVKHNGGWVTAYAHLSRIAVKMRDPITQGQQIGEAGQTGAVDRPQLHFEIRYARNPQLKAAPVDPTALLPTG